MAIITEDNEQLLLLSSTDDPYFRDCLDLLFYPSNIDYRFRYNRQWVSKDFKSTDGLLDEQKVGNLKHKSVLIINALTEKRDNAPSIRELLPIREAKVTDARVVGDFIWLSLNLGDWILYSDKTSAETVNQYNQLLRTLFPSGEIPISENLVVKTRKLSLPKIPDDMNMGFTNTLGNWTRIAKHVSRFSKNRRNGEKNVVFLKLIKIQDSNEKRFLDIVNVRPDIKGFILKSEHSYNIDIVEYTNQKISPFELELKLQEELFSTTLGKIEIRGKYDVLSFSFLCKATDKNSISAISFEPTNEDYVISKPVLWSKVKTRKWAYVGLPLFFFAISTIFTSEQFFNLISGQLTNIWTLGIGATGTIFSTVSLLYFRKGGS